MPTLLNSLDPTINPTLMSDVTATKNGLKTYSHNANYNGGIAPTITLSSGGGTLVSVPLGVFVPYQVQDGTWRMRFNIYVLLSTTSRGGATLAVNGVTHHATGKQGIAAGSLATGVTLSYSFASSNSNTLTANHSSVTTDEYVYSGDTALASKPTWAY